MTRTQLFDEKVWETRFCFQDLYESADDVRKQYIDNLTDKELEEFINENSHGWEKGMEAGMMSDWTTVANACQWSDDCKEIELATAIILDNTDKTLSLIACGDEFRVEFEEEEEMFPTLEEANTEYEEIKSREDLFETENRIKLN